MENKAINRKGLLLMKNYQDRLEYHIYDNKLPYPVCTESIDINEILESYYISGEEIYLKIENNDGIIISGTGKLRSSFRNGVIKYFINDVDLETILFNHTEEVIHIEIKRINDVALEEGDKKENEPRENKDKES
jgi:hypothetical protein